MSKNKKIFSVICIALILVSCFSFSASALVFNDGDFGYEMNSYTKEMALVEYKGSESNVIIPSTYGNYPVTRIKKSALSGNSTIQNVNFPLSMRKVDDGALSFCKSLTSIHFPSYISNLGNETCLNCTGLLSAQVNAETDKLPDYTFTGCSSLKEVSLGSSIKTIGSFAFQNCISLENANFISQVNSIERFAFDSSGITKLTVPEGVEEIPEYCFSNCSELEFVSIHKNVTSIDSTAFVNDPKLVLGVYFDSYAYHYAKDNNIAYKLLDEFMLGNVDSEEVVNINDVTAIQRNLAELEEFNELQLLAADANCDKVVDIFDATAIQMYCAGFVMPTPIGKIITQ